MGLLKPRMLKGIAAALPAFVSVVSATYAGTDRWDASQVVEKIDQEAATKANKVFDPDWGSRVFKEYYMSNGTLMYVGVDGVQGNADDWAPAWIDVTTSPGGGNGPGSVIGVQPVPTPSAIPNTFIIATSPSDGEVRQDALGNLWYKLPGMNQFQILDAAALNNPDVLAMLQKLGISFTQNPDGTITFNNPNIRGQNGMGMIIIGMPNNSANQGSQGVLLPGIYGPGGQGSQQGLMTIPGLYGPGATAGVQGMGGFGFFPNGQTVPTGSWGFTFNGSNGAAISILDSAGKIMDPAQFRGEPKAEVDVLGLKYRIQRMKLPGLFDWSDEYVILRQGQGGQWYLIDAEEHKFLMAQMQSDPEKYKDFIKMLKKTDTDVYDQSDYDKVWEHDRLYKNAPRGQSSSILNYGSINPSFYGPGGISIVNAGASGAGAQGAGAQNTIQLPSAQFPGMQFPGMQQLPNYNPGAGMAIYGVYPNGGGQYTNGDVDAFIKAYLLQNPNASLADIQAALNGKFGNGAIIISANPGGGYQYRMGPNGANGPGSSMVIFNGGAGGQFPHMTGMNIGISGQSAGLQTSIASEMDAYAKAAIASMGVSSSSSNSGTTGKPATPGTPGSPGSSPSTGLNTAIMAGAIKSGLGYAIKIPVGPGKWEYFNLDASRNGVDYKVNADGSITILNQSLLDALKAKYPGVDFSLLSTASGSSPSQSSSGLSVTDIQQLFTMGSQVYLTGIHGTAKKADGSQTNWSSELRAPKQVKSPEQVEGAKKALDDLFNLDSK